VDVSVLSGLLASALPFLLSAGQSAADEAAKKLGSEAWDFAMKVWKRLHPSVAAKPAAQEVVTALAAKPDNPAARGALTFQLQQLLDADPQLDSDLRRLWSEAGVNVKVTASGDRSVAFVSATDTTIVTGDDVDVGGG
jgi:hypothetical protein